MKIKDYKFIKKCKSNSVTSNSPETKSEASSIFDVLEYYQDKFKYICIFFKLIESKPVKMNIQTSQSLLEGNRVNALLEADQSLN